MWKSKHVQVCRDNLTDPFKDCSKMSAPGATAPITVIVNSRWFWRSWQIICIFRAQNISNQGPGASDTGEPAEESLGDRQKWLSISQNHSSLGVRSHWSTEKRTSLIRVTRSYCSAPSVESTCSLYTALLEEAQWRLPEIGVGELICLLCESVKVIMLVLWSVLMDNDMGEELLFS